MTKNAPAQWGSARSIFYIMGIPTYVYVLLIVDFLFVKLFQNPVNIVCCL